MKECLLALWLLACACFPAGQAQAQGFDAVVADAQSCLVNPEGPAPSYPRLFFGRDAAVVRVELRFDAPDAPPTPHITFGSGNETLARVVLDYVAQSRWPCLVRGRVAAVIQEFQFIPGDPPRVLASAPLGSQIAPAVPLECTASIRAMRPPSLDSPLMGAAERTVRAGKVLVQLTFSSPTDPPAMKVLFGDWNPALVAVAARHVAQYRLPCASADKTIVATQQFVFNGFQPTPMKQLKGELSLMEFLRLVRGIDQYKDRFDFDTMGCPFQFRFEPWMPYTRNGVRELGAANENRRFFLEWARGVTLDLSPEIMRTAAGEATVVTVPCGFMDLSR